MHICERVVANSPLLGFYRIMGVRMSKERGRGFRESLTGRDEHCRHEKECCEDSLRPHHVRLST
jgi:hypothetical protein